MNQADPPRTRPLSDVARRALTEVASQLEGREEATRGLCARSEIRHTKHGKLGPDREPKQTEERLGDPEAQTEEHDLLPLLTSPDYERQELPSSHPNELRVRATQRGGSAGKNEGSPGADLTLTREPAQLVRAALHPPAFAGLVRLVLAGAETEMRFDYVNGVPMPVEVRVRMRSRGIGRFRLDQETVMTVRYEPCA